MDQITDKGAFSLLIAGQNSLHIYTRICTRFQCAKFFRPKIWSCKFFLDKFQVWLCPHPKLILIDVDYHNFNDNHHVLVENIPDRKMLIIVDELLSAWSIVIY